MRRRNFIAGLASTTASWPLTTYAQQAVLPVVGLIRDGSADTAARYVAAFRKGLNETGYVEGQNVTVEYHWLEGQYDRPAGAGGRSGSPSSGRDRHARQHAGYARGQSCNSDDPDRLRCR